MATTRTFSNHRDNRSGRFSGNLKHIVFWVIIGLVLATLFALVFGILVKLLWGVTLSPIFGIPEITYWQAVGIVILSRLVFGGFGHRGGPKNGLHNSGDKHGSFGSKLRHHFHGKGEDDDDNDTEFRVPETHRKHYHEFWEKEGKQAFNEYLSKIE